MTEAADSHRGTEITEIQNRLSALVRATSILLAGMAVCACSRTAYAHKLQLYAEPEGATIRGEAYYQGGGKPRNVEVVVLGPDGRELGRTRTDDQGRFTFQATLRCDHRFIVDSGDGHMVECKVRADELPAGLAAPAGAGPPPVAGSASAPAARDGPKPPGSAPAVLGAALPADGTELQRLISQAVRRELEAYEQRVRWRDLFAGIGYILGIFGVAVLVRRRVAGKPGRGTG